VVNVDNSRVLAQSTGGCRKDHVTVETLLERAKLSSVNRMVVKATALEAWSAFVSKDEGDGSRNSKGRMIFDNPSLRPSRFTAAGKVVVPSRGVETFVTCGSAVELVSRASGGSVKRRSKACCRHLG
jgi:hypothetical protein